jgi:hypothetical protein
LLLRLYDEYELTLLVLADVVALMLESLLAEFSGIATVAEVSGSFVWFVVLGILLLTASWGLLIVLIFEKLDDIDSIRVLN